MKTWINNFILLFLLPFLIFISAGNSAFAGSIKTELNSNWEFKASGWKNWYKAEVPGFIHTDLLSNDLIPDPFFRDNEFQLDWIGKTDWEYRTHFIIDKSFLNSRRIDIVFNGLDTYCDVFLNGQKIMFTDNMFREWRVNVKSLLKEGKNSLKLIFYSPINRVLPEMDKIDYKLPASNDRGEKTSPYTRKAPYNFGWDWGPRLVTCGIWQPVFLEAVNNLRIADMFVRQNSISKNRADLTALLDIESEIDKTLNLRIKNRETGNIFVEKKIRIKSGINHISVDFSIKNPLLWWPNGLGAQHLYTIYAEFTDSQNLFSEKSCNTGLRILKLVQKKVKGGKTFFFEVNGVPVFAKGGNWIPADNFPTKITDKKYRWLLKSCKDANMNMLRVWGGGIYEKDIFYDLCDSLGILLWQDFMFACSMYPGNDEFLKNVEKEALYQTKRLRNHPSIALWCGNNEVEVAYNHWGWKEKLPEKVWVDYKKIFHELLPSVCKKTVPLTPYWPSSPSSNLLDDANSYAMGDMHYWGVWHGEEPFSKYRDQFPRFMSEYGFQSFPLINTVYKYTWPEDLSIDSDVMKCHQKHPRGNKLINKYMLDMFNKPKDFKNFLYLSEVLQAKGIKIAAEHLRKIMPLCMGSLYWQIDDCWPVASWSGIDYYGRWKALHFYARRFYANTLVIPENSSNDISVFVVTDSTKKIDALLNAALLSFSGDTLWNNSQKITIVPVKSRNYLKIDRDKVLSGNDLCSSYLFCEVKDIKSGKKLSENFLFFDEPKALSLNKNPKIDVKIKKEAQGFSIEISSDTLVLDLLVLADRYHGHFTDNFFNLVPGRPHHTFFRTRQVINLEDFRKELKFMSVNTSF